MSSHFAYLFVTRNMGNGYSEAYPNCSFLKNWIFDRFLKPLADRNLNQKVQNVSCIDSKKISDVCQWRKYYVLKYECPDTKCDSDPFSKGRCYFFKLYIILEGKPNVLPPTRFDNFIEKCINAGQDVFTPGANDNLKIPIPDIFFDEEEN